jgi:hypothetical protein
LNSTVVTAKPEASMIRLGDPHLALLNAPLPRRWGRGRERRSALATLLCSLAEHVRSGREVPTLGACLETGLKEALRVQDVHLRESPPGYGGEAGSGSDASRRASLEVPTRRGVRRMVLEATLESELALDPWDMQLMQAAAQIASLVVEIDHNRSVPARAVGVTRRAESNAPPLIGSSPAMTTLREHIARVASTDFTVLIQGESGR